MILVKGEIQKVLATTFMWARVAAKTIHIRRYHSLNIIDLLHNSSELIIMIKFLLYFLLFINSLNAISLNAPIL